MGILKDWVQVQLIKFLPPVVQDKTTSSNASSRLENGTVKKIGLRSGDVTSRDFEPPEFNLIDCQNGYNADGYIRQGVDKYVDQIFKEGYDIYGKNEAAVEYVKLRLSYMSEATGVPTEQMLIEIAEDIVKYANCIVVKARVKDPSQIPPGASISGLLGMEPIAGYFLLNPTTMKVRRDRNGTVLGWQQEVDGGDKPVNFKKEDIVHFYYKRERGNAFGTPFLVPVLDDVRALRQAEENVLRMLYRNIYPFYHVQVGDKESPGMTHEINEVQTNIDNMSVEGGIVTTNRVVINPIAADKVIDAEPYLRYCEDRVFSGLGIPAIMFGRGDTANRSTGDSMSSEMSDRIKAMHKTFEMFFNHFILRELLLEGGFDPVLNPDDMVRIQFHDNDMDKKVKLENHAIFKYEHNTITEDEMRALLGRDPLSDRAGLYLNLIDIPKAQALAAAKVSTTGASGSTKETDNKNKPANQHGVKTSPKKQTNSEYTGFVLDEYDKLKKELVSLLDEDDATMIVKSKVAIMNFLGTSIKLADTLFAEYTEDGTEKRPIDAKLVNLSQSLHASILTYMGDKTISKVTLADLIESQMELFQMDLVTQLNKSILLYRKEDCVNGENEA